MLTYGWICPKCGRVYAPNQEMCLYCRGGTQDEKVSRDTMKISWDTIKNYYNTTTTTTTIAKEGENYATNRQGN